MKKFKRRVNKGLENARRASPARLFAREPRDQHVDGVPTPPASVNSEESYEGLPRRQLPPSSDTVVTNSSHRTQASRLLSSSSEPSFRLMDLERDFITPEGPPEARAITPPEVRLPITAPIHISPPVPNQNQNSTPPTPGNQLSLWTSAYNNLSLRDQEVFDSFNPNTSGYSDELIRHIKMHRDLCQENRWKFAFRGKIIVIRDVVDKVLAWVDRFKGIGDIIMQYDPGQAALPWAAVRFLLQVTIADKETMGAIITGLEVVTRLLVRCSIYEHLYLRGASRMVHNKIEETVVLLYVTVLEFLAYAKRYFARPAHRLKLSFLAADEASSLFDAIAEKESALEKEIVVAERSFQRLHQDRMQENHDEVKSFLKVLDEPISRVDENVSKLHFETTEYFQGEKRLAVLNWLSKVEYKRHHEQAKDGLLEGTGQWLLDHEKYREWRSTSASGILWLHGIPGAGKTKLTCMVIETLISQLVGKEPVVYFYCNRNDPQRQDPEVLMQAILKQLSIAYPGLSKAIVADYNQRLEDGMAAGTLMFQESQSLILSLLDLYPQTTIVVDAIDECDPGERWRLLEVFKTLLDSVGSLVKIFVSSRDDIDIKLQLEGLPNLYIDAKETSHDIERFVKREIETAIRNRRLLRGMVTDDLKKHIVNTIVEKAQGMFQWADLQIKSLCRLKLASDVEERLTMLPATLESTYSQILDEIKQGTPKEFHLTTRSLVWIIGTQMPLDRDTWAQFSYWPDAVPEDGVDCLFSLCRNLVTWDRQLDRVIFAHLSVQEYLEGAGLHKQYVHSGIAGACISGLPRLKSSDGMKRAYASKKKPTLKCIELYMVFTWFLHVELSLDKDEEGLTPDLAALLRSFLGTSEKPGEEFVFWVRIFNNLYTKRYCEKWRTKGIWSTPPFKERETGLCGAVAAKQSDPYFLIAHCRFGKKFDEEFPISSHNVSPSTVDSTGTCERGSGPTSFYLATQAGNECIMDRLLAAGADFNAVDAQGNTPLKSAVRNNHIPIVLKLLDLGAKPMGGSMRNMLRAVAAEKHVNLMTALLLRDEKLEITEEILEAAAGNFYAWKGMLEVLLPRSKTAAVTEKVIAAAASNTQGYSILQMFMDMGVRIKPTETILLAAVGYWTDERTLTLLLAGGDGRLAVSDRVLAAAGQRGSLPVLKALGSVYDGEPPESFLLSLIHKDIRTPQFEWALDFYGHTRITESGLVKIAGKCSERMIEVLLRHPDHRRLMRQEAFVLAVTRSNKVDVLETLLDFNWEAGDSIKVTESILIHAVSGPSGNRWSEFSRLLKRVKNTELMTEALMSAVLKSIDENAGDLVRGLLDYFGQNIVITDAHIKAAISQGLSVTELKALMAKNPTFEVIGATLIRAARYAPQLTFVGLMADVRDITDIRNELFYAAAKNCTHGHQITEHLLGLLGGNSYLPEGAVLRALRKWTNRGGALSQLLQSRHIPKITRRVVVSLTKNHDFGPPLLAFILNKCPQEARSLFTEEAIASTARRARGYEMIKTLAAEDVPLLITERLAAATAKNQECGPLIIEELLAGGYAIVITEDRMEALWEDHPEKNTVMRSFRARLSEVAGLSSPPVLLRSSGFGYPSSSDDYSSSSDDDDFATSL